MYIHLLQMCFYIRAQAWIQHSQTSYYSIVIIASSTPRNLTRLTCFVVAAPQVGVFKATPRKKVAAAALVSFWCRLVWHREDRSKMA